MASSAAFLTSGFDASGANFAAVFQGLDSHRLRVVPAGQSGSGSTAQEFVFDKGVKISTLEWINIPGSDKSQQLKKRKKGGEIAANLSSIVLGTTQGTVLVYSLASNSIVANLKTGSSASVCSLMPSTSRAKLFALQVDSTLTEFDVAKNMLVASSLVSVSDPAAMIYQPEQIIANTAPHLCRNHGKDIDITYTGFATPVRQLLMLGSSHFAAVAEEDRQVLIYRLDTPKPIHSLMCPSTNAVQISAAADLSAVAIATEDGHAHVFENPLQPNTASNISAKSKRSKPVPQSAPKLSIEAVVVKRGTPLQIVQTRFIDNQIMLVWPEQGSVPVFDTIVWRDDNGVMVNETIKLEKTPSAPLAKEHLVGGVDPASAPKYAESDARVISGEHVADLSDEETGNNNDDEDGETLADRLEALEVEMDKRSSRRSSTKSISGQRSNGLADGEDNEDDDEDDESEGNMHSSTAKGNSSGKSNGSAGENNSQPRLRRKELKLKLAQPGSFATLLNQALTLSDKQLLEICLEERDPAMVKTSIVKLEPALAASLLEHVASTMARSQNRSATLTQWIRWVVVIHGAYLVTLPNLLKTLAALHSTLSTRASTLPRLLALQGRLEMLEEQLAVRSELAAAAADEDADEPEAYYDEEEALIVNGEEANDNLSDAEEDIELDGADDAEDAMDDDDGAIMLSDE